MPRRYTLGKRDETKAATRALILESALRVYLEVGSTSASVSAIARAADVSPGTVRNHFPGPTDLAEAAADAVLDALHVPDETIFDGLAGPIERATRLVRELAAFSERSTAWWEIRQRDRGGADVWAGPEARYEQLLLSLVRTAVSPLDGSAVAVTATAVGPLYYAIRGSGASPEETVDTVLSVLIPWLEGRLAGGESRSVPPSRGERGRARRTRAE